MCCTTGGATPRSPATPTILVVDAVSSLGIAELSMDAWGVDAVVAGSQKGLMLPPGLAFCALSGKAWRHAAAARLPKYYFDLAAERKAGAKNDVRFTPAVSLVDRHARGAAYDAGRGAGQRGSSGTIAWPGPLAPASKRSGSGSSPGRHWSPAVTAVVPPAGVDSEAIVAAYSKDYNISDPAGGQGEMKGKLFRLGHMGYVAEFDIISALAALEQVLADLGLPVDFGASVRAAQKVFAEKS